MIAKYLEEAETYSRVTVRGELEENFILQQTLTTCQRELLYTRLTVDFDFLAMEKALCGKHRGQLSQMETNFAVSKINVLGGGGGGIFFFFFFSSSGNPKKL